MDASQLGALLKSYGAPDTPENVNRITQRYASDPTAADRRIYGLQGQSDESGGSRDAVLNAMLDRVIAQTDAPITTAPLNAPLPTSPMVQNATAPTRRSATAASPREDRPQYGPGGTDPLAREVNRNTPSNPNARPPTSAPQGSGYEVDPQTSAMGPGGLDNGDNWMMDLIAPIVGILGAGALAKPTYNAVGKRIAPITPPEAVYAGPMNTQVGPNGERVTKTERIPEGDRKAGNSTAQKSIDRTIPLDNRAPSTVTGSPENEVLARKAQVQAELDAANAEGSAIQREMMRGKKQFTPKGVPRGVRK